MAQRVVLHVGLMKSGTTFIQGRLDASRDVLADLGVLFPGPSWGRHSTAVSDFIGARQVRPGAWVAFRDEIRAHPGAAVVSMEYLGPITPARITALVEEFPDADVDVVVTVRDLGRTVPAMWQETVKNRRTWTWADYLHSLEHGGDAATNFWRQQGAARIVNRWAAAVGTGHVSVVTVPPPGAPHDLLWERFRAAARIGPAEWADAPRANESLGVASALLMRRLNEVTGDLDLPAYKKRVKALGKYILADRRAAEAPIGFTVPPWLHETARGVVGRLAASGVDVVGDLADLTPVDVPGADPGTVSPESELQAAVDALSVVLLEGRPARAIGKARLRRRTGGVSPRSGSPARRA